MLFESEVAEKIKQLRKSKKLSQNEFAVLIGTTQDNISRIENNKKSIDIHTLRIIAEKLKVSTDFLLGLSEAPTDNKDLQFVCDYTNLKPDTINFFAFQRSRDNVGFYENTIAFIENLVAKIWGNPIFTININALIDDITILARLYDAQILKRNEEEPIIIGVDDVNEKKEILESVFSLQQANSEEIENIEDVVNSMKYKLTRFLNEFLEEFVLINSGCTLKEFEELESNYYKP